MSSDHATATSIMAKKSSSSHGRPNDAFRHHRRFYFLHSALALAVLALGMINNGGNRKFIPVNQKELFNLATSQSSGVAVATGIIIDGDDAQSCHKAYANVHSSSVEDEFSAICCSPSDPPKSTFQSKAKKYKNNLCHPQVPIIGVSTQQLPFARRLTRLTEAWVLPLLPILIRLVYQLVMMMHCFFTQQHQQQQQKHMQREATSVSNNSQASSSSFSFTSTSNSSSALLDEEFASTATHKLIRTTLKRLLFYLLVLNIRGWGLYIGANALEDYVILPLLNGRAVISPLRTDSMSDMDHDLRNDGNDPECWYKGLLKSHHKSAMENNGHSDCYGRPFDFSDHAVLFLAHYLPVFVMEMLLCYSFPFWGASRTEKKELELKGMIWSAVHVILFLYLHLIVLQALCHTAAYFHTPAEMLVGYGVSLILQLPLGYLMCSDKWHWLKKHIGLPSEGEIISDKGD